LLRQDCKPNFVLPRRSPKRGGGSYVRLRQRLRRDEAIIYLGELLLLFKMIKHLNRVCSCALQGFSRFISALPRKSSRPLCLLNFVWLFSTSLEGGASQFFRILTFLFAPRRALNSTSWSAWGSFISYCILPSFKLGRVFGLSSLYPVKQDTERSLILLQHLYVNYFMYYCQI